MFLATRRLTTLAIRPPAIPPRLSGHLPVRSIAVLRSVVDSNETPAWRHKQSQMTTTPSLPLFSLAPRRFNSSNSTPNPATNQTTPSPVNPTPSAEPPIDAAALNPALVATPEFSLYPTAVLEHILNAVHTSSGLPYWVTIVATTIGLRTVLLPLALKTMRNSAILSYLRPQIDSINQKMKDNMHDREASYRYSLEIQALFAKYDCNPFRSMLMPLIQAPIFITFFMTLRNMAESGNTDFTHGGALWFTDLCLPDPYYALPIISSLTFLTTVEVGADGMQTNPSVQKFMRILAFVMVPMVATFPSGIFMYWITSNCYSLVQVIVLKNKAISRSLGIPQKADLDAKQAPVVPTVLYSQKPRSKPAASQAKETLPQKP